MKRLYIGVEIGASKHQAVLGDGEGNILSRRFGKVVLKDGAQGILAWMKENIPTLIAEAGSFDGHVEGLCIGFGGIIETATGISLFSVQVDGWKDFPIARWFEQTFGIPSYVVNDTTVAGYGEYRRGSGVGSTNFFYTNIGSGIGGIFIVNGVTYDGIGVGAGYFGHTYVPDWTQPQPGAYEKVENMCSGFGIERRLRREGYIPKDSCLYPDRATVTCRMLGDAAKQGDAFAAAEIDRIAKTYSIGMSSVITMFAPDRVSIGGGVARMGNILLDPIRRYTEELVFDANKGRYEIVYCRHEDDSVPIGALLWAASKDRN